MFYEPSPKNTFTFKVNDEDLYSLKKEEVDFDPSKTEQLAVNLKINGAEVISVCMPWIIDEVEERIQSALGFNQLTCLEIKSLDCMSWIANEFIDVLTCYDMPEQGLDKLILHDFKSQCAPFEEEVVTRLIKMCPRISHLQLSGMHQLDEEDRMEMVNLFRQIIQNSPPIQVLNMNNFSESFDKQENVGENVQEALLSSNIDTITDLNLSSNGTWFQHPDTGKER